MTTVLAALFGLMLIGVPVAFSIISAGMVYLATSGTSMLVVAQRLIYGLNSFTLLAVPLFILVGNLMDFGGISKRLTDWAKSLLGWLPGGLGIVTVFSCAIFAALTGSGPATVAAIGSIMLPSMLKAGYSKEESAGLVAAAGALGRLSRRVSDDHLWCYNEPFHSGDVRGGSCTRLGDCIGTEHCQCALLLQKPGSAQTCPGAKV